MGRDRHSPARGTSRWAPNVALTVASVAVTLLVLELLIRCFSSEGTTLLIKDDVVGQRYHAGFAGRLFIPEAGHAVYLRFNRLGFRGPDRPEEKPANVHRVAVLGDSFVAGVAVEEPDTIVAQLEQRLNAGAPSARWEVLNFGIGGFSTAQSLLTWRNFARRFAPDVVILCFYNGNDLWDNDQALTTFPRPYFSLDANGELVYQPLTALRASVSRWLNEHSHLYVWQNHQMQRLRGDLRRLATGTPPDLELFNPHPPPPYPEAWRLTEKLIATLAEEVTTSGAQFLLVSIPAHEEVRDEDWKRLLEAVGSHGAMLDRAYPATKLGEIAAEHHIRYLPLVNAMRVAHAEGELSFPGGHLNERGNHVAAAAIYQELRAMRIY